METWLNTMWLRYSAVTPSAIRIQRLLQEQQEPCIIDHIALRTFSHYVPDKHSIITFFIEQGYSVKEAYDFPSKHLKAVYLDHNHHRLPKVFVSELQLTALSESVQSMIAHYLQPHAFSCARQGLLNEQSVPWQITYDDYQHIYKESPYASWVMTWGLMVNHFTLSVNSLKHMNDIHALIEWLNDNQIELNHAGGVVKGQVCDGLKQASTVADKAMVILQDGEHPIPAGYYEFAERFDKEGRLFEGFIPESAQHIFTSTDTFVSNG